MVILFRSDELRELEEYRKMHTFSSFEDAIHYVLSVHPRTLSGLPVTEDDHHDGEGELMLAQKQTFVLAF